MHKEGFFKVMDTQKIIEIMQQFKDVVKVPETTQKAYLSETLPICCGRIIETKDKICPICKTK